MRSKPRPAHLRGSAATHASAALFFHHAPARPLETYGRRRSSALPGAELLIAEPHAPIPLAPSLPAALAAAAAAARPDATRQALPQRSRVLQRTHDVLLLSLARRDAARAARALRILMLAWEWKTQDLWRLGLDVAGLHAQQQAVAEGQAQGSGSGSDAAVQARIAYLRGLMRRRGSLRAKLMLELVPLMIQAGKGREALEEIELSVNRFPYRVEPALHLYAGLLILQLSSLSLPPPSSGSSGIARPPGAPFLPPFERPRDDAILAAATHHLQGAVNAGAAQAGIQRARAAVVRRREERKAAKKRKRAADGEATGDEYDEAPPPPPPPPGDQSDEEEGDDELPQGEWAAELARSYLDMLNVPTQLGAAPRNRADRLRDRLARESQA